MKLNNVKNIVFKKNFVLIIITFLALLIRLLNIDKSCGLWNDEILTYTFASRSFPLGILKVFLKEDFHMPLYYLYLGAWMKLLGTNDIILRLASVLWGVLNIPALFLLGKTYKSEKLGYLLALVGCFSPIMIMYSQELRFYSLLIFFATISITYFLKLIDTPSKKNLLIFSISNLIILYTYTMGVIFIFTELLILFRHYYFAEKDGIKDFLKITTGFILLTIPYLIIMSIYLYSANRTLIDPIAWAIPNNSFFFLLINDWFSPILSCCYIQNVEKYTSILQLQNGALFLALMLSSTFCFLTGFIISLRHKNNKQNYLLIILICFLLTEVILQTLGHLVIVTKYTLIVWPIVALICTNGLIGINSNKIKTILISIIFTVFIYNILNYKNMDSFENRIGGLKYPSDALMKLKPNGDYLLALERAELFSKYTNGFKFIDFDAPGILYLYKDKKDALKIFDKQLIEKTNKYNSMNKFIPYLTNTEPTHEMEQYINSQINTIPKGKRLIYIEGPFFGDRKDVQSINGFVQQYLNGMITSKTIQYELLCNMMEKISIDVKKVIKNNPEMLKTDEITLGSPNPLSNKYVNYKISLYKKI